MALVVVLNHDFYSSDSKQIKSVSEEIMISDETLPQGVEDVLSSSMNLGMGGVYHINAGGRGGEEAKAGAAKASKEISKRLRISAPKSLKRGHIMQLFPKKSRKTTSWFAFWEVLV